MVFGFLVQYLLVVSLLAKGVQPTIDPATLEVLTHDRLRPSGLGDVTEVDIAVLRATDVGLTTVEETNPVHRRSRHRGIRHDLLGRRGLDRLGRLGGLGLGRLDRLGVRRNHGGHSSLRVAEEEVGSCSQEVHWAKCINGPINKKVCLKSSKGRDREQSFQSGKDLIRRTKPGGIDKDGRFITGELIYNKTCGFGDDLGHPSQLYFA